MNFIDLINDQQRNLKSSNYVDALWCKINNGDPATISAPADEDTYRHHIPLDFSKFLKMCVKKLRELKLSPDETTQWDKLDQKYLCTLIYFGLEQEDITMDSILYSANIFILINTINAASKRFFHLTSYFKVLQILSDFNKSQEMATNTILFLMDDFKTFLSKFSIPDDTVSLTISVIHHYTYYCNDPFENITADISYENLGYIAFVSLKILAEQLSQQKNAQKNLFAILMCLTSSLQSKATHKLSRTVTIAHQENVRLFISQNFNLFSTKTNCLVAHMLKVVCLSSEYDEFEAIALLIQQLPKETHKYVIKLFENAMFAEKVEFRKKLLNLILPVCHHPADYVTKAECLIQMEVFIRNTITLLIDKNEDIKECCLKIITEFSEDRMGKCILKKIMCNSDPNNIGPNSIQDELYKMLDKNWSKKAVNVNYIHLMCNLLIVQKNLVTVKALNRLRNICLKASPYDLKPCMVHLKRLLTCYPRKTNVVMYILDIFVKQMLHPLATSVCFAKELHDLIFSCISQGQENDIENWHIINYLISNNFDVAAIFEKFHSLNLLKKQQIRLILKHKIDSKNSRTPALKLLGALLQFVPFSECHCLHEKLEESINSTGTTFSGTDQYLIVNSLIKIIERKNHTNCNIEEINEYRKMQVLVSHTFYNQMFPDITVKYIVILLKLYENLITEDTNWASKACSYFEENFTQKLTAICNRSLQNHIYICRDVNYISDLVILCKTSLTPSSFTKLRKIVTVKEHSSQFLALTIQINLVQIHAPTIDRDDIEKCYASLEEVLKSAKKSHDNYEPRPIIVFVLFMRNS